MTELLALSNDGHPITALDDGRGPALLIVHPGGGDATTWDRVTRHLTDDFRVVRILRRIYAPGADIALPHSMTVEAADILAVAKLLKPPVLLLGHSSGAVAALEAALLAPSVFAGLFLYEPPLSTRELVAGAAGKRIRAELDAGDPVEAMRIHMRDIVRMPVSAVDEMFAKEHVRAAFGAVAAASVADTEAIDALGVGIDRFATLALPTTLVEGDLSPTHLRERLADLAATLPNARVVTLPGQGHFAQLTAPETLADEIREMADQVLHLSLPRAEFAFPGPLRDQLVAAILDGSKTSTTGLVVDYEHEREPLPEVGSRSAVIDSDDRPVAIIEVTGVRVVPLAQVDLAHALDEGEGDTSVAGWRAGHEQFWHSAEMRAAMADPEFTVDDATLTVLVRFRLITDLRLAD